jgi:hypothetical protein
MLNIKVKLKGFTYMVSRRPNFSDYYIITEKKLYESCINSPEYIKTHIIPRIHEKGMTGIVFRDNICHYIKLNREND